MIILKILLMIILYLFIFLLSILFILLISPIKGSASLDTSKIKLKGSYLFGILKIEYNQTIKVKILGFNLSMDDSNDKDDSESEKKKDVKEKKKFGRPSLEILHLMLDLIKKLIKIIAPKEASLQLTLGLDDPYYTEMAHIISMVLFLPLNSRRKYNFHLTPVLNDIAIDYRGYARINFSIIQLILPVLRFFIRKPIREYFNIRIIKRKP